MSFRWWLSLLALQIFGVAWAILIFASPIPKSTAGLLAGGVFVLVGLYPLWLLRKESQRGRWVIFWSSLIFLLVSAVPILGLRLAFWGQDFSTLTLFGIKTPQLHAWSESFYMAMLISTLWDGFRHFILKRK
jgi:hypothetical protein